MRNFSPRQKFWAIGHTVSGDLHFNDKETGYVWLSYFSPGKFSNRFYATAKSPATTPAVVPFNAKGRLEFREISLGWLHYFKGSYRETKGWSLFGRAGFGLKFSKAENVFEPGVVGHREHFCDTSGVLLLVSSGQKPCFHLQGSFVFVHLLPPLLF